MPIWKNANQTLKNSPSVLKEVFKDLNIVSIPTKTDFRGINKREAAIFRGPHGWSEFAPFVEYGANESSTWLRAALEAAYRPWPQLRRNKVEINATLPRVAVERVPEILKNFPGTKTIKIKVNDFENDSYLVEAALDFNPDAKIRLDVNGGWSFDEAALNIYNYFMRFGKVFEYIEQPCLELSDLAKLKKEVPIKIAIDESIRKAIGSDFSNLKDCADVAIIKWAPSGGFEEAQKLISTIGLPVVLSSALDTGIGISHGLALAASQIDLPYACGLGTVSLLESDIISVVSNVSIGTDGTLEVKRLEPDEGLLKKYAAPEERRLWWLKRIEETWELGEFDEYIN